MKLYLILFILICSFGCYLPFNQASYYLPSDAEMERNFLSNEEAFNKLVEMFEAESNSVSFISEDKIKPYYQNSVSDERWSEYQKLFESAKTRFGMSKHEGFGNQKNISFFISSRRLSGQWKKDRFDEFFTGDKGYMFSRTEPKPLEASLDIMSDAQIIERKKVFKKLKDNWYIYYSLGISKPE